MTNQLEPTEAEKDAFFADIAAEEKRKLAAFDDLVEALEQVMRPYGMHDIAASHSKAQMQDEMIKVGRQIRAAIAKAKGETK